MPITSKDPSLSPAQTGEPLQPTNQGKVIVYDAEGTPVEVHAVDARDLVKSGGYSLTPPAPKHTDKGK